MHLDCIFYCHHILMMIWPNLSLVDYSVFLWNMVDQNCNSFLFCSSDCLLKWSGNITCFKHLFSIDVSSSGIGL